MALHFDVARYILSLGFPIVSDGVYDAVVKTLYTVLQFLLLSCSEIPVSYLILSFQ
jgi:hypothetical protein